MKSVEILGYPVDTRTPKEIIQVLLNSKRPMRILQINPETVMALDKEDNIKFIENVDIFAPNGVGIQWAATFQQKPSFGYFLKTLFWVFFKTDRLKAPLAERFNSASFTWPLLEGLSKQKSAKILIAGSPKDSSITTTAAHIRKLSENLQVLSFDTANFDQTKQGHLTKLAQGEQPDLVLLGIGYPAQEHAASALRSKLPKGIIVSEGGTFDYELFGGTIKRAPAAWQNSGVEWLWRLLQEPVRLKRQLALLKFIFLLYKSSRKSLR